MQFRRIYKNRRIVWDEYETITMVLEIEKNLQAGLLLSRGEEYYEHVKNCDETVTNGNDLLYESCSEDIIDESLCDDWMSPEDVFRGYN